MTIVAPSTGVRPAGGSRPSPVALALVHFRYQFLETVRVPMAVLGTMLFPALALLFFVVPQKEVSGDPVIAAAATAQLAVFAVMSTSVFTYGIGVAEDRALPFDPYLRTLPTGPGPRLAGRVLNGTAFSLLGLVPPLLVAVLLTEASAPAWRVAVGIALVMAAGVPFLLIGLTVGYLLSSKAAVAMAQVIVFPLAFAGGLFVPPDTFRGWLDTISTLLPSRAARDLVVPVVTGGAIPSSALPVLIAWTVLFAALTAYAYRRDEGRRFR